MNNVIFVFIILFIIIRKINNSNNKAIKLLEYHQFQNLNIFRRENNYNFYTAQKAGDNYLIQIMIPTSNVTQESVLRLVHLAQKYHFHNMILIPASSFISDIAKKEIDSNSIQILNLNEKISSDESEIKSSFISKMPLNDNCHIDEPQEAIQDGKKANSIFGNFFRNKVERL